MTVLLSALAFFLLLSVLILVHEWGHFYAARKADVIVEEFGFGLPPRAKTIFEQGGTQFSLNWIPFGGFVRLRGENALTEKARTAKGSFGAAPIHSRIVILSAGVFMNFMLAIALLTIGFSVGRWIPTYFSLEQMEEAAQRGEIYLDVGVLLSEVVSGGSAAKIGVPPNSIIAKVDGIEVSWPREVSAIQEGKEQVTYTIFTGENFAEEQEFTIPLEEGKSGVELAAFPRELSAPKRGPFSAFLLALREARVMTVATVGGIGALFVSLASHGVVPEGITGIVGIAQLTYVSVQDGFMTYLRLVALLSLSLAVLNILPFPALDGGRLLFVLAELVSRRPVNRRFEMITNAIGFSMLLFLILVITFYDIIRLF